MWQQNGEAKGSLCHTITEPGPCWPWALPKGALGRKHPERDSGCSGTFHTPCAAESTLPLLSRVTSTQHHEKGTISIPALPTSGVKSREVKWIICTTPLDNAFLRATS